MPTLRFHLQGYSYKFIYYLLSICVCTCVSWHVCGSQRTTCRDQFFSFNPMGPMYICLGIKRLCQRSHFTTFNFWVFPYFLFSELKLQLLSWQRISGFPLAPVSLRWNLMSEWLPLLCWSNFYFWDHLQSLSEQALMGGSLLSWNILIWETA